MNRLPSVHLYTWPDGMTLYRLADPGLVRNWMNLHGRRHSAEGTPLFSLRDEEGGQSIFYTSGQWGEHFVSQPGNLLEREHLIPFLVDLVWLDGKPRAWGGGSPRRTPQFLPETVFARARDAAHVEALRALTEKWHVEGHEAGDGAREEAIEAEIELELLIWLSWVFEGTNIPVSQKDSSIVVELRNRNLYPNIPQEIRYNPLHLHWLTFDSSRPTDTLIALLHQTDWLMPRWEEAEWRAEHWGKPAFDLSAYRLLGLPSPVFAPLSEFNAWVKGIDDA